jgi:uncharacterized membrane protein YphA (DoxX/SURF4 family)
VKDNERSSRDSPAVVVERLRYVPAGIIVAIVLLRLAIGWHFYREGTKKLAYDPTTGKTRVAFSAEPFLRQAVGPLASRIRSELPNLHEWERLLVVPRKAPMSAEELAKRNAWTSDYMKRRREAMAAEKPMPIEFPPDAPYFNWAERVSGDWEDVVAEFRELDGLNQEQKAAASAALEARRQQLADYLAGEENSFLDWQHELWRLGDWEAAPESTDLPFQAERIDEKRAETAGATAGWVAQVRDLERGLYDDLREIVTNEQATNSDFLEQVNGVLGDAKERNLRRVSVAVTCVVIGVGVCLLLGLFTRLAALGGIGFLAMVVATQPPWVAGANTEFFYYQLVEIAALLVLFASAAGRWAGLDFFIHSLVGAARSAPQNPRRG